ncbi:MAG: hypothetical protein HGB19_00840 [Chlorobiales bacterium]|nr:hypothetical protein [Chlorobiales bacterium]
MKVFLALVFLALPLNSRAQPFDTWKSLTSLWKATSVAIETKNQEHIWVGTEGGLYRFNPATKSLQSFTNTEGLLENSVTALCYDASRHGLWIGFQSGGLSFYSIDERSFSNYRDLMAVSTFENRAIRAFAVRGDTVMVATDFGMALFTPSRREFRDIVTRLGSYEDGTAVRDVCLTKDKIILATLSGVATASLNAINLQSPDAWKNMTISGGGTIACNALQQFGGKFYVATEVGLFTLAGAILQPVPQVLGKPVIDLSATASKLLAMTAEDLIEITSGGITHKSGDLSGATAISASESGLTAIADSKESLIIFDGQSFSPQEINTPISNVFAVVRVDDDGRVWASSSFTDEGANGFSRYENGVWINFQNVRAAAPQRPANQFSDLLSRGGNVYLGTWGSGLLEFTGNSIAQFDNSNSALVGTTDDPSFIILPSLSLAADGTAWMTNFQTASNPIYSLSSGDLFSKYGSSNIAAQIFPPFLTAYKIASDPLGQKWIAARSTDGLTGQGLVVFNDNNTATDLTDDTWIRVAESSGFGKLPNNTVNDITVDLDGAIWIATARGAAYFFDGTAVSPGRIDDAISIYDLRSETVTAIVVDALNRKWCGSKGGVWLLTADGSAVLQHYTSENSALLSNTVLSIGYDKRLGKLYFGTDKGLSVLSTTAIEPKSELGRLKIYPNPYHVPSSQRLVVEGLTRNASLKIMTISGKLVRNIPALGGSVVEWDGKDSHGKWAASGIYLAVAVSADGKDGAVGKIAVLNR